MKKVYIVFRISIIFLFFVNCDNVKKPYPSYGSAINEEYTFILKQKEIMKIKIPATSIYRSRYVQYFHNNLNNEEFLLRQNENINGIEFYNLKEKRIEMSLSFNREGPDGIGKIRGFYFHNFDTIFVTSLYRKKIFIIDTSERIKQVIDFSYNDDVFSLGDFYCYTSNKIIYADNSVFISTIPDVGIDVNPELFFNSKIGFQFDLKTNKETIIPISYPISYIKENYTSSGNVFFSRTFNPYRSELVYSFPADHNLYIFNPMSKQSSVQSAKSQYVSNIRPVKGSDSFTKRRRRYLEEPKYYFIAFDKFRKVYYRFVLLPIETEKDKLYKPILHLEMPFSVMVLDTNFKVLAEKTFPKNKFFCNDYFISKEGLWISNNHPENPEFDEGIISFTLFNLQEMTQYE